MSKIFICYRRWEDEVEVDTLCEALIGEFKKENVFRDVDGIRAGDKWREVLDSRVRECDVMLAVIGPNWLTLTGRGGRRRIDLEDDWVRFELETAIARDILIVPVVLQQGQSVMVMPNTADLPESIHRLADCQFHTLRAREFRRDLEKLINDLKAHDAAFACVAHAASSFDSLVETGEWVDAKSLLDDALAAIPPSGPKAQSNKLLIKRQPVAKLLHGAAKAFERSDFLGARSLLEQVPEAVRSEAVSASVQLAAIGSAFADGGAISPERIAGALDELGRLVQPVRARTAVVPGEMELRNLLRQHERKTAYDLGIDHYAAARFASAAGCFERAADYRDAAQWRARIGTWSAVFEALKDRRWSDARTHMRSLKDREDEARVRALRQWCLLADKFVPALHQMAEGGRLAEPAVPWEGGKATPYAVLGVTPSITHADVLELGFEGEKVNCDALRVPDRRLLIDFATYAVRDGVRARRVVTLYFHFDAQVAFDGFVADILRRFTDIDVNDGATMSQHVLKAMESGLGEDAGILFAILGNHDVAIQRFLETARRNPADHLVLHHLGLAACAKAHLDPVSTTVGEAWSLLCVGWGAVFADDRFWNSWWAQLRRIYPVTENAQVQNARTKLQRFWMDELKVAGGLGDGSSDAFETEVRAARALAELRGIPSGGQRAVVGLRGIATLELEAKFHLLVGSFRPADVATPGPKRNLCIAFSRLALPLEMIAGGRNADAISVLQRMEAGSAVELTPADLGFRSFPAEAALRLFQEAHADLLRSAHLALARDAVTQVPADLEKTFEHWEAAMVSARRYACAEELLTRIRDVVMGRAHALREAGGTKREQLKCLDEAVRLIEEAERRGWDGPDRALLQELVTSYLDRAVYLSNEFDMEKAARSDAHTAYGLMPESLRAVQVLCHTSLYYAKQLSSEGRRDLAAAQIREVILLATIGEARFDGNSDLARIHASALQFQKFLDGNDDETVDQILSGLQALTQHEASEPVDPRLKQALLEQEQTNYEQAAELYWQLVQEDPDDQELRGKMCFCYRLWLLHLAESGDPLENRHVLDVAQRRCGDSLQLREIFESYVGGNGDEP